MSSTLIKRSLAFALCTDDKVSNVHFAVVCVGGKMICFLAKGHSCIAGDDLNGIT